MCQKKEPSCQNCDGSCASDDFKLESEVPPVSDRLSTMWGMQKELNKRCGIDADQLTADLANTKGDEFSLGSRFVAEHDQKQYLGNLHIAMSQELAEFRDSIPWKWWKAQKLDLQNAKVEVVDMFHFVMSMAQVLGMTEEDFFQAYMKKNAVNHTRQDGDYKSNPNAVGGESDCKHI